MTIEDLLFESVSYWRVDRFSAEGFPVEAHHVDRRAVSQHAILGMPSEVLSEDLPFTPRDPIFIDGIHVPPREVIRFVSPNPPLLKHAARAIRMLLLLDKVAEVYANDPMPLGYFTDREDADPLDDSEIKKILDDWQTARKSRAFGYVPQSLELKALQWDASKIQLSEARQHAVLEIARATGLDPEDIGVSTTSRTYQNAEQRRTDLIDFVLMEYMNAVEERLSKDDVLPHGLHARYDTSGFLRSSTLERMQANKIAREIGAITDDEIRTAEHRASLTPAEKTALEQRARPVAPAPNAPTEDAMSHRTNGHEHAVTFTDDGGEVQRFEFPEVDAQFRIDRTRRVVAGLILPWDEVAMSGGFKWRFKRGSIRWGDVGRVKLLRDHDMRNPIGRALELDDRDDGLYGTFSIARGADGDTVLSMAEDGVLDGFSVGPIMDSSDSWQRDPVAADVRLVGNARLVETSIVAIPSYDSARVASVHASRKGAADMGDKSSDGNGGQQGSDKPTVLDTPDAGMQKFQQELDERFKALTGHVEKSAQASGDAIAKSVSDAVAAAFGRLQDIDVSGRGAEAAARIKVISEPPVYRFDGNHHAPSLVRDAWAYHMDRDFDARDRMRKFQEQQQDLVNFATITTGTASAVIPPGYRPDLYVTQLMQGRPIVSFASRGTISDATPFTVPRFTSATGATADHVQGVNPTDGTLVLDTATVTPGAVSGVFKLTREVIDAAN
ncbi:MAG: phage portal protein, partial [Vicinamibacterales bacterium]